jgi:hypothetical protein
MSNQHVNTKIANILRRFAPVTTPAQAQADSQANHKPLCVECGTAPATTSNGRCEPCEACIAAPGA